MKDMFSYTPKQLAFGYSKEKTVTVDSIHLCDYRVIAIFSLNFFSSPVLINLNKWIYAEHILSSYCLMIVHFVITFLFLLLCVYVGIFKFKRVEILRVIPLATVFCGFVVLTNLSLQYNTVGTSQLIKTMTTPCIIVIQYFGYHRVTHWKQQLTVIPILIGVFLNSFYDVKFNIYGLLYASSGVVVASVYQVWVAEKQRELSVNSMQLLLYQAPLSSILMVPIISLTVPVQTLHTALYDWSVDRVVLVLLSGVLAFLVNLSIYWIIGNTSPVTYNMIGHLKFCVTVTVGYILFDDIPNTNQACGVMATLSGVWMYSQLKMNENRYVSKPQCVETETEELQN